MSRTKETLLQKQDKNLRYRLYNSTISSLPAITEKVVSPLPIRQGESYSLAYSKRLASVNWASRPEYIIYCTNFLAPSTVPTSTE